MRIFSEFIVLHEDGPMPDAEQFCPSFWRAEDFDSDGDFYYDGIAGRWTRLELTTRTHGNDRSRLVVQTYYANNRLYEPGNAETADLARFVDYLAHGRFAALPAAAALRSPAVTSLSLETPDVADYREFLDTVYGFLVHSRGFLANVRDLDAAAFRAEFLEAE
ncbi:MAG TPA: hypothetical protein VHW23_25310 [Kofleriaceae bacterium]|jgi:hypothetical protein|nr:hypothetical protein [Kofleriaceae bacterium]